MRGLRASLGAVTLAVLTAALPAPALAQKVQLQVAQGPYYTGVPIDLQIVADDFDEEPQPEVRGQEPDGARLEFVQARPQVSSMMQILNGKVTQSRQVRFAFVYRMTASKAGRYRLGPFTVVQGDTSVTTNHIDLLVGDVPQAGGQQLHVRLPDHPIFVGQRVPVTVEWWTEDGLADRLFNQRLVVPLFLDATSFQFLDEDKEPSRIAVRVDTPGGEVEFPADVRRADQGGRRWVIRSFTRTMVAIAAGRFEFDEPALFCEEATSFQRDFFGSRVPSRTRPVRVAGEPMVLDVQTVPAQGRPASFAGAIGQGFAMDVSADRTVVQTGDPVKLTFTIRGDGSLDTASLPPLTEAGLSPEQFRVPAGRTAGVVDDKGKHFEVTVRVVDPAVREIPPIEYSWFDPAGGGFQTTRSAPIALSVREATVVGAGDVVSAAPARDEEDTGAGSTDTASSPDAAPSARKPRFTLTGAELSIETDLERLRVSGTSRLATSLVFWVGYGGGLLALALGLVLRRRRDVDPVRARLLKDLAALRSRVTRDRSAREVADALRRMASLRSDGRTSVPGLDQVLARLDEAAFAPGGGNAEVASDLRDQATAAADAIVEELR